MAQLDIREAQDGIQEAIRQKPEAHCFEARAQVTELREMVEIGG